MDDDIRLRALNNHFIKELETFIRKSGAEMEKLRQLMEASTALNSTLDLGRLLDIILETALKSVDGDRGTVYLVDRTKEELWSIILRGKQQVTIRLPIGRGIAGYVAASGDTLNIPDAYLDPRFNPDIDKQTGYRTTTILCMPMRNKDGKIIGVFQLLNKRAGPFTADDENFIAALSTHASLAIENARLYGEEKALAGIREEVRLRQRSRWTSSRKSPRGRRLTGGTSIPAQMVGATITISSGSAAGRWGSASATCRARGCRPPDGKPPCDAPRTDAARWRRGRNGPPLEPAPLPDDLPEKFVTLIYGALDPKKHTFRFANAGHDHPCLFRNNGETIRLESGGDRPGILPDYDYTADSVEFHPGDAGDLL